MQEYDKVQGFSDSWAWYQYLFGSVCKFRVYSTRAASNVILKVSSVVGTAQVRVFIMDRDAFTYPQQAFDVVVGSSQTDFNISSNYFEYLVYVLPDTFSSGSYRIDVQLEQAYQPAAFVDDQNNTTDPSKNDASSASTNETTSPGNTTDSNNQEDTNSTQNTNEAKTNSEDQAGNSTGGAGGQQQSSGGQSGGVEQPGPTGPAASAGNLIVATGSTGSSQSLQEDSWHPSRLIKDKESFMLLLVVASIFGVLCCFMICIGYWLSRHSWK